MLEQSRRLCPVFNGFPITNTNNKITLNGQDIIDGAAGAVDRAQSTILGSSIAGGKYIKGGVGGAGNDDGDGTVGAGSLFRITRGGTTIGQNAGFTIQNGGGGTTLNLSSNPIQNGDVLVLVNNIGSSRSAIAYGPEASQVDTSISVNAGNNTLTHVCSGEMISCPDITSV